MGLIKANRKAFDHGDLSLDFLGGSPTNFTEVSYEETSETQKNHGKGRKPNSYSEGNIDFAGTLTLGMDEVAEIERAAPNGRIADIKPFIMTAAYVNEDLGTVVDKILCKFQGNKRESTAGAMNLQTQFPLLIMDIEWNVPID